MPNRDDTFIFHLSVLLSFGLRYRAVVGTSGLSNSHTGLFPTPGPKSFVLISVHGSLSVRIPLRKVIAGVARSKKVAETIVGPASLLSVHKRRDEYSISNISHTADKFS